MDREIEPKSDTESVVLALDAGPPLSQFLSQDLVNDFGDGLVK